jgi:hypothetical protein
MISGVFGASGFFGSSPAGGGVTLLAADWEGVTSR